MNGKENDWIRAGFGAFLQTLVGAIAALAVSIMFLGFASAGISAGWIGDQLMGQITLAACAAGAFAGGKLPLLRNNTEKQMLYGILTGIVQFLLILAIGTVVYDTTNFGKEAIAAAAACLCGGALSGLLSQKSKGKKKTAGKRKHTTKKR